MNNRFDVNGNPDPNGQYDQDGTFVGNSGSSGGSTPSQQNSIINGLADYGLQFFRASQAGTATGAVTTGAAPAAAGTPSGRAAASSMSSVPMWVWIAGGVAVVILFLRR